MLCSDIFPLTVFIDFIVAEHDVLLGRHPINTYGTDLNGLVPYFIAEKSMEKLRGLSKVTQLGSGRSETRSSLPTPNSAILFLFTMKHHLIRVLKEISLRSQNLSMNNSSNNDNSRLHFGCSLCSSLSQVLYKNCLI